MGPQKEEGVSELPDQSSHDGRRHRPRKSRPGGARGPSGSGRERGFARREFRRRRRRVLYSAVVVALVVFAGAAVAFALDAGGRGATVRTAVEPIASQPEPAPSKPEASGVEPVDDPAPVPGNIGPAGDTAALEERLGEIADYYGGVYGVKVLDPSSGEQVSLGAGETFFAASIGKLPALLALYKSAARGAVDLDDDITMQASDVQSYGTGVLHTYEVGYTLTLRECAFYLVNDSDNTAWKMLTRYLGEENIQAEMNDIGAYDTEYWIPNTTTADDVMLMLQKIADPDYTSPESSKEMLSAMTNTFSEDRIPGGLPPDARVAHKIGTYGTNFSDAGVVSYKAPGGPRKNYFIVVFTDGLGESTARAAIQEISAATYQAFGPGNES